MGKKRIILVCGLVLLLAACQAKQTEATKSMSSEPSSSVSSVKELKTLEKGMWEDKLYARLSQLIKENGRASSTYQESQKPYAVFDWDNTTVINDIGEATFVYQISHLAFKMTPEQFEEAIRMGLPADNFSDDYRNKDNEPVNIDKVATDLVADYQFLYQNYSGFAGTQSLDQIKMTDQYKDFSAKLLYLYEAIGDTFSSDISYPWVTYLYAGMTSEEVQALSEKSIDAALKDDLIEETWESPASLKGQAGQVSISYKRGVRSVKEMQDLYATLMANGIDVYICSASYYDVIYAYATNPKYGYNIPKDNVFGMRLMKDEAGIIQPSFDTNYVQTQGDGKTETIKRFIASQYDGAEPILIAGDSNGDYAMMKDFDKMQVGIIFNLLRNPEKGIGLLAKEAVASYGQDEAKYFLQGRDENKGVLLAERETIKLGKEDAKLMKE